MKVAICYNEVPRQPVKGEIADLIAEAGAEAEAAAVAQTLKELGHQTFTVPLGGDVAPFIARLCDVKPDLVFNLCEGFWGESGREMHVSALLELLGFPHTGAGPFCLGFTQNKTMTKALLLHHGLPTPRYFEVPLGAETPADMAIPFPLIVKPSREDASVGITAASIVTGIPALRARVSYVHKVYRQPALVEEFIDGREINAAVIGDGEIEVLPFSEIRFHHSLRHPIVSYDGKWREESAEYGGTVPVCPAPLLLSQKLLLKKLAAKAYKVCECRDYARIDIRVRDGQPYILEVNANPDISPDAGLARSAAASGWSYRDLVARIVTMAFARKEQARA